MVPEPVWVGSKWLLAFLRVPLTLGTPLHFLLCCPLNDRRRAAHSFFKIDHMLSLVLFSCPSLALLRLLFLLLLLKSGNVHPNPGPIFPCSVCTGNVTWQGKSVQCCTCSKWVHLRCSQLTLSKFRALGSSHSWSCPPCQITVTPSSDSSDMYISTVQASPASANAALLPHPHLQTCYPPSAHFISSPSAPSPPFLFLAVLLCLLPPLPPDFLRVLQWNAGGLQARSTELLHFFFRPILSTLTASRNPILTHLPISRFSALRSDRTHSRSGILSLDTTHASSSTVIFIRQGLSFSELSTSFLSLLDPYSDYVGIIISLNNSALFS